MSLNQHRVAPPPLPKSKNNNIVAKLVRSLSLVISAVVVWVQTAIILGLYVMSQPEEATGEPLTLWEVIIEEHHQVFLVVNLFYFFVLIPVGLVLIAMGILRLYWWGYLMVPTIIASVLGMLFAFSK
ncbi:MAG: hypothetical protein L3J39_04840 [Verrucomicrobiales bacterium]|nr:hypothetical protein [Verrucomicrobiales bacterium]